MMSSNYNVIVIGAGPAGSTAAALLAERGRRVLVLEKDRFPRYSVGESLLPYCYFPLKRLGLIDKMKASTFTKKYSVQFIGGSGKMSAPFYFFQHMDHEASTTWQVVRSEFDLLLADNAIEKGAEIRYGARAVDLLRDDNGAIVGVLAESREGEREELRAPVTIDASGRTTFGVAKNDWRVKDATLNKVAVWTYYRGALRDEGRDEGATTIAYLPEKGWFWYIPLPDDLVSVGIVAEPSYLYREGRDPEKMFAREIENNVWIKEHLSPGKREGAYHATGDYSYRSKHCAMDGLVLAGDAFSFLDPVFSSGVFLALKSGEWVADAVENALAEENVSAAQFEDYGDTFRSGLEAMRKLVYAFYDEAFSFRSIFEKYPDLRSDLTDCLIGNLEKDFDPLFSAIAEFAKVPEPLPHGRPQVVVESR